jgi:type VI secretion system protein ImpK
MSQAALATTMPAADAAAGAPSRSLPDLCAGLFAYVLWLRGQEEAKAPDVRAVYQRFDELLRDIDAQGQRGGAAPERVRLVLFALVAFADEMILTSKLPFRAEWADQPLQLTYFNENAAGEEFFTRLETSRRPGEPAAAEVLESYYLCLSLGFKGRFGGSPKLEKQRRSFMERLAADISAARGAAGGLSPHVSPATGVEPASGRISVWLVPVLAALALLAVAVVLNVLVNNLASDAVAAFA